jgi:hypothetical protein
MLLVCIGEIWVREEVTTRYDVIIINNSAVRWL